MCSSVLAFLASSMVRSISVSVIFCSVMVSGPIASLCFDCAGEPLGEPELCLFRISFGSPLPYPPVFSCAWSGVACVLLVSAVVPNCRVDVWSSESLSESRYFRSLVGLVNRQSGPRARFLCCSVAV